MYTRNYNLRVHLSIRVPREDLVFQVLLENPFHPEFRSNRASLVYQSVIISKLLCVSLGMYLYLYNDSFLFWKIWTDLGNDFGMGGLLRKVYGFLVFLSLFAFRFVRDSHTKNSWEWALPCDPVAPVSPLGPGGPINPIFPVKRNWQSNQTSSN